MYISNHLNLPQNLKLHSNQQFLSPCMSHKFHRNSSISNSPIHELISNPKQEQIFLRLYIHLNNCSCMFMISLWAARKSLNIQLLERYNFPETCYPSKKSNNLDSSSNKCSMDSCILILLFYHFRYINQLELSSL